MQFRQKYTKCDRPDGASGKTLPLVREVWGAAAGSLKANSQLPANFPAGGNFPAAESESKFQLPEVRD